jgi:hypothetical protein
MGSVPQPVRLCSTVKICITGGLHCEDYKFSGGTGPNERSLQKFILDVPAFPASPTMGMCTPQEDSMECLACAKPKSIIQQRTNTWTQIRDMHTPCINIGTEVFATGGYDGHGVEYYDEKSKEWFKASDMNVHISSLSACGT